MASKENDLFVSRQEEYDIRTRLNSQFFLELYLNFFRIGLSTSLSYIKHRSYAAVTKSGRRLGDWVSGRVFGTWDAWAGTWGGGARGRGDAQTNMLSFLR